MGMKAMKEKAGWIALAGIMLLVSAIGAWNGRAEADQGADGAKVLAFAESHMMPGSQLAMIWYGESEAENGEDLTAQSQRLSLSLGIQAPGHIRDDHGHTVYEAIEISTELNRGVTASLYLTDGQMVIRLEAPGSELQALAERQSRIARQLDGQNLNGQWSASAKGALNPANPESASPADALLQDAEQSLQASSTSIYEDGQTLGYTFISKTLRGQASSKDPTNLQISLHRDTESGKWNVSVGTPMLSGEF